LKVQKPINGFIPQNQEHKVFNLYSFIRCGTYNSHLYTTLPLKCESINSSCSPSIHSINQIPIHSIKLHKYFSLPLSKQETIETIESQSYLLQFVHSFSVCFSFNLYTLFHQIFTHCSIKLVYQSLVHSLLLENS